MTTTASKKNTMRELYSRLRTVGISAKFARTALPGWWDDEIAQSPAGLQQAHAYLARAFNIDFRSLVAADEAIQFKGVERKFKLSRNLSEVEVEVSAHFAAAVAKLAIAGVPGTSVQIPSDPRELRERCLAGTSGPISLISLLHWCMSAGIPVIHVEHLPGKKMAGMVVKEAGRFAIVLCKRGHPSILLFHLAHELGHIAKNHIQADGFVVDEQISQNSGGDKDEVEADAYAVALINGRNVAYSAGGSLRNALTLYNAALLKGTETQVDPGHIILNYAHNQGAYPLAFAALKHLPGETDGAKVVNEAFFTGVDPARLSSDQLELIQKFTGYTIGAQ